MRPALRWLSLLPIAACGATFGSPRPAQAGEAEACIAAIERGEPLKKRGQLVAARQELSSCAKASCPGAVREMCRAYLDEVDSAMTTLEVAARDDQRRIAPTELTVTVDGRAVVLAPDGTYAVDPGARTVRVTYRGAPRESLIEVTPGKKRIPVVFSFESPPPPRDDAPREPTAAQPRSVAPAIALGALSVLALGGGVAFGVKWSHDAECRPRCAPDETSRVRTDAIVTDVLGGVGLVAAGAAIVWLVTAPAPRTGATRTIDATLRF